MKNYNMNPFYHKFVDEGDDYLDDDKCQSCRIPSDKRNCALCDELHDVPPTGA